MRTVSRSTGTDTDSFAYANDGCPSVLISIPLRYMHTTVEMLHKDDIENTIRLMYETLLTLTPKTNLSYFKYNNDEQIEATDFRFSNASPAHHYFLWWKETANSFLMFPFPNPLHYSGFFSSWQCLYSLSASYW